MNSQACADLPEKPKIVAFGDSLVTGYGTTDNGDFVSILSSRLEVPITNLGRDGETSASARERIADVVRERPDVVIILLGGNDALQKVPVAETRENLDAILTTLAEISSVKINIVLVGVLGSPLNDPYRAMFEELAEKHQVEYVPNILSGIFGNRDLMSDQIHPNNAGHARMAERIYPAVLAACESVMGF
ncbi:MAG TPA: GDSL-type esterase/lipase family protein [Candidatus Paceibacterota bacterium]|nr:GDSL-type esterase/lipase family protein [Candidatus Paceibacterota bacterium]